MGFQGTPQRQVPRFVWVFKCNHLDSAFCSVTVAGFWGKVHGTKRSQLAIQTEAKIYVFFCLPGCPARVHAASMGSILLRKDRLGEDKHAYCGWTNSISRHLRIPGMMWFPVNTKEQGFPMVSKWCRISSKHTVDPQTQFHLAVGHNRSGTILVGR